ncbi:MAG: efflux transporter outer membrane subunit [Myxococcales bacterium]|nr:efflux transporter outer membrane subunit [Myxococcales bacterium]
MKSREGRHLRSAIFPAILLGSGPLGLLSEGCGSIVHSVDATPPPPVPAYESWSTGTSSVGPDTERWWESFNDPRLTTFVDAALSNNLDLVAAAARLEQARAILRGARAGYFPQVNGTAAGSRSRTNFNLGSGPIAFEQDSFSLQATASYEVDVWGRVAHAAKAANRQFQATREDLRSAAMTVVAQVAATYFEIVEQRATLTLLEEQLEASRTYLELVELRFDQGVSSGLDVFQQRQQLAGTLAAIPPVKARLETLETTLSVLLARPPRSVDVDEGVLPALPPSPPLGIPATLVQQRPDVRAAELRVVAQDHQLGSAIADRFPRVNLDASLGFRAFDLADLFQQFVWSLGASITGAIFDGGRRNAEVDRNRAILLERLADYGRTILTALEEVEAAIVNEAQQKELIDALELQLDAARSALQEARLRYANGLTDYLPVLTALTQVQELERRLLSAERQMLAFRIQLYRALGGSWEVEMENLRESNRS